MIKIIKGIYALEENGIVVDKTPESKPFSLSKAAEAELVDKGCAVIVEEPQKADSATAGKGRKKKAATPAAGIEEQPGES